MATTNLGKVSVTPKGEYDPLITYERLDVISHNGSSYIVKRTSTGVTPIEGEFYALIAEKGDGGSFVKKAYKTYAAMDADKVNIPANSSVDVTNDPDESKNGAYIYDGVAFTRSQYDSKVVTDKIIADTAIAVQDAINNTAVEGGVLADTFVVVDGSLTQRTINKGLESISDLSTINNPKDGLRVYVKSYHAGLGQGGGYFTYDSAKASINNHGNIINGWVRDLIPNYLDLFSFGAVGDGVTDDTDAFIEAGKLDSTTILIPEGSYKVSGTIPVYCSFIGLGKVYLDLTVSGGTDLSGDRGFWLQSNSSIRNVHIRRDVTGGSPQGNGAFNGALLIGQYHDPNGKRYENITVSDVIIEGVKRSENSLGRASIFPIIGNVSNIQLNNIDIIGLASFGLMVHWSGDFQWDDPHNSIVTKSFHPNHIQFKNIRINLKGEDNTIGGTAIWVSAAHDLTFEDVSITGCSEGLVIFPGDAGGFLATGESIDRVLTNLIFKSLNIKDCTGYDIRLQGASKLRASGRQWLAIEHSENITFTDVTIEKNALMENLPSIYVVKYKDVTFNNLNVIHKGHFNHVNRSAVYIGVSKDIYINGQILANSAWAVNSSLNVVIDTRDICPTQEATSSTYIGGAVSSTLSNATVYENTNEGSTSINLNIPPKQIIAGLTLLNINGKDYLAKSNHDGVTDLVEDWEGPLISEVILDRPLEDAVNSLDSVIVNTPTRHVQISGVKKGFYQGLRLLGTDALECSSIKLTECTYDSIYTFALYVQAVKDIQVLNSNFINCGSSESNRFNIYLSPSENSKIGNVIISNNSFEDNTSGYTHIFNNIYVNKAVTDVNIESNKFYRSKSKAIYHEARLENQKSYKISNNWFSENTHATLEGYNDTLLIGDKNIGISASVPESGLWQQGDIILSTEPNEIGWKCVQEGSPGTWVNLSNITTGTSTVRPTNPTQGFQYFDTDLGKPIYWNGTSWVDSTGQVV